MSQIKKKNKNKAEESSEAGKNLLESEAQIGLPETAPANGAAPTQEPELQSASLPGDPAGRMESGEPEPLFVEAASGAAPNPEAGPAVRFPEAEQPETNPPEAEIPEVELSEPAPPPARQEAASPILGQAALIERHEPDPAPPPVQPAPAGFSRGEVVALVLGSNLLTLILAVVIGLGVMANLNRGALQFVQPVDLQPLTQRLDALEQDSQSLANDQVSIRSRLDNLEAMTGRVSQLEKESKQMEAGLVSNTAQIQILSSQAVTLTQQVDTLAGGVGEIRTQVDQLQTSSDRYQQFLDGLAKLLANLLPKDNAP